MKYCVCRIDSEILRKVWSRKFQPTYSLERILRKCFANNWMPPVLENIHLHAHWTVVDLWGRRANPCGTAMQGQLMTGPEQAPGTLFCRSNPNLQKIPLELNFGYFAHQTSLIEKLEKILISIHQMAPQVIWFLQKLGKWLQKGNGMYIFLTGLVLILT